MSTFGKIFVAGSAYEDFQKVEKELLKINIYSIVNYGCEAFEGCTEFVI